MVKKSSLLKVKRSIVLATASRARRKLVADAGIEFDAASTSIDETALPGEDVSAYVDRLAREKAKAAAKRYRGAVIIAVDTAIFLGGEIIGKPKDRRDASRILRSLSGRQHEVITSIAVMDAKTMRVDTEVTHSRVRFIGISDQALRWYLSTNEWKGKAGAYAIQGKGAMLIDGVEGCITNVIGISMPSLMRLLKRHK
jgi:septum formation protein